MIKGGVALGLNPAQVRAMTPLDFRLMVLGFNEAHAAPSNEPGANAPSLKEAQEMVAKYG